MDIRTQLEPFGMKRALFSLLVASCCAGSGRAQATKDAGRIEIYVTPYYNCAGPRINIGQYSEGLSAKSDAKFVATISRMKQNWANLSFIELYVGAIRLYDMGYRNEATYWFYSAQYRGRVFATLLDERKKGSIGDTGFELSQAQNAFQQLAGPYLNGYAFGDIERLAGIIDTVQKEGAALPDLSEIYPGVVFKNKSEWEAGNKEVNEGLSKLRATVMEQKESIKQQRIKSGTEARFSKLKSKDFMPVKGGTNSSKVHWSQ
jgi:hypothetical protein